MSLTNESCVATKENQLTGDSFSRSSNKEGIMKEICCWFKDDALSFQEPIIAERCYETQPADILKVTIK